MLPSYLWNVEFCRWPEVSKEPYLAALCAELAAAHFQFEELTLYPPQTLRRRGCAELFQAHHQVGFWRAICCSKGR